MRMMFMLQSTFSIICSGTVILCQHIICNDGGLVLCIQYSRMCM